MSLSRDCLWRLTWPIVLPYKHLTGERLDQNTMCQGFFWKESVSHVNPQLQPEVRLSRNTSANSTCCLQELDTPQTVYGFVGRKERSNRVIVMSPIKILSCCCMSWFNITQNIQEFWITQNIQNYGMMLFNISWAFLTIKDFSYFPPPKFFKTVFHHSCSVPVVMWPGSSGLECSWSMGLTLCSEFTTWLIPTLSFYRPLTNPILMHTSGIQAGIPRTTTILHHLKLREASLMLHQRFLKQVRLVHLWNTAALQCPCLEETRVPLAACCGLKGCSWYNKATEGANIHTEQTGITGVLLHLDCPPPIPTAQYYIWISFQCSTTPSQTQCCCHKRNQGMWPSVAQVFLW